MYFKGYFCWSLKSTTIALLLLGGSSGCTCLTEVGQMLSIEECKKHLKDVELTDEKIGEIRDVLYSFAESALDKHLFSGSVSVQDNGEEKTSK